MFLVHVTRDVLDFNRKYGRQTGGRPSVPDEATITLRCKLIDEEYRELIAAIGEGNVIDIAKEAVDLIYVTVGCLVAFGIDPRGVWREVHRANMTRDGGNREDGKSIKGPGYREPEIAETLGSQRALSSLYPECFYPAEVEA